MPWLIPWRKAHCFYCHEDFPLADCAIVASADRLDGDDDPARPRPAAERLIAAAMAGPVLQPAPTGLRRWLAYVYARPLAHRRFTYEKPGSMERITEYHAARQCPRCGRRLPDEAERLSARMVSLIGPSGSTKSHVIAALIHELVVLQRLRRFGCTVHVDEDVLAWYRERYHHPLFNQHTVLPLNDPVGRANPDGFDVIMPLVFVLDFVRPSPLGKRVPATSPARRLPFISRLCEHQHHRVSLVIYDAAGDQIQRRRGREDYGRYIEHAAARIFLVDPLVLKEVYNAALPALDASSGAGTSRRGREDTLMDTSSLVGSVADHDHRAWGWRWRGRLARPTAIVLGKADLLRFATNGFTSDSLGFVDQTIPYETYTIDDLREYSRRVESFIERCEGGGTILGATEAYPRRVYLAVSATGKAPVNGVYEDGPEPKHVLDPLLWILSEFGVIDLSAEAAQAGAAQGAASRTRVAEGTRTIRFGSPPTVVNPDRASDPPADPSTVGTRPMAAGRPNREWHRDDD